MLHTQIENKKKKKRETLVTAKKWTRGKINESRMT